MLRNYLKIGVRNLLKNKLFTLINISGMAISIAVFLIIALFIADELKFDQHVEDADLKFRIYSTHYSDDGSTRKLAMVSPMIAPTLASEYPEVDYYFRFMYLNTPQLFEVGDKKITEPMGGYGEPTMFDMFSLKILEGSADGLKEANTIALSKTLADKYFQGKSPIGETIEVSNFPRTVKVVYEDFSVHSHLQLNYIISMESLIQAIPQRMQSWGWSQFHTYVKFKTKPDVAAFDEKLKEFTERNAWPSTKSNGFYYIPQLMELKKIHLHSTALQHEIAVAGNAQTVYILSATAIFILIIAILNFINLSTARAVSRVKEVGVRKVVGAIRTQLIYQFISESVIIALISLFIGGLITELILPGLNSFTEKSIPTGIFLNPMLLGAVLVFAVMIGVAAGAYPAFYISSYKPAQILSNRQSGKSGKILLRKGLVVLQFMLSFFLIIAALVVSEQHTYMRTKDMGFNKDNVIVIRIRGTMYDNLEQTKALFSNHPNIISASMGYGLPGEAYAGDGFRDELTKKDWGTSLLTVDHDYVKTLGLTIVAGRDFSHQHPNDTADAFIISEQAAKMLGHKTPEDALGHPVSWNRWDNQEKRKTGQVVGVIKDMHLNSLRENITPIMLHIYPFAYSSISFRVKGEDLPTTIAHLEASWKKTNTEWPFEYRFLDGNFDKMYKSEEKLATLFRFFTGFTIFVACLGLFGLVSYSTSQKFKEISIRKVLGAEEGSLVIHLGKSYVLLVCVAFIVAIPFSYYAAESWLTKFAFRIELTPILFIKAASFILIISLVTVGLQSLKAARANPVDALKEQ